MIQLEERYAPFSKSSLTILQGSGVTKVTAAIGSLTDVLDDVVAITLTVTCTGEAWFAVSAIVVQS